MIEETKAYEILDEFGKLLIKNVRDRTMINEQDILRGKIKGDVCQNIYESLEHLNDNDKENVIKLVSNAVTVTLHNFLMLVNNSENQLKLMYKKDGIDYNLSDLSLDFSWGLPGDLLSDEGWIASFSQVRIDDGYSLGDDHE